VAQQKLNSIKETFVLLSALLVCGVIQAQTVASYIAAFGYDSCVQLKNKTITVIIDPNAGGRVLSYSLNGVNVLYEDSTQNGWISTPQIPRSKGHLAGGRFDIGPSRIKPNTDLFFFGKWKVNFIHQSKIRLTSKTDPVAKLYLIRDFVLDASTSKLSVTQTIVNSGNTNFKTCFWGRTFATGNGICIMPVNEQNRFPKKYIMFMNRDTINMFPVDNNIVVKDDFLIIKGPPSKPKLEMDVAAPAWIAYATTNNRLFIKKFKVYDDRQYGDVTAANTSIWYNGTQMTEIEPIGPLETIDAGKRKSFTEYWYISEFNFPVSRNIDVNTIKKIAAQLN
jgi:hypothetical protein